MRISDWSSTCALPISRTFSSPSPPAAISRGCSWHREHIIAEEAQDRRTFPTARLRRLSPGVSAALRPTPSSARDPACPRVCLKACPGVLPLTRRSEEHTSELQSLMRISYAVFCLKKKKKTDEKVHKH